MKNKLIRTLRVIGGNTQLKIGLLMLCVLLLVALLAPVLAPYDPYFMSDELVEAPSGLHPLGTNGLGQDVLSMLIFGTRTSLLVGVTAAFIAGIIGTLLGGVAGYFGGVTDAILGELINVFMMMPTFFLVLIVVALFGSGLFNVMVVMGLTSWVGNAKLMRAQAMSLRQRTFVRSAEAIGESRLSILFRHVVPNGIFPIIAWGQVIQSGKSYLTNGWWICLFGGLAIIYTVVTFYLVGDGLNRVLSPKLRNLGKE